MLRQPILIMIVMATAELCKAQYIRLNDSTLVSGKILSIDRNGLITYRDKITKDTVVINREDIVEIRAFGGRELSLDDFERWKKPTGFIGVGVNPVIPFDSYNSSDENEEDAEFAGMGYAFRTDFGMSFGISKIFGITSTLTIARSYGDEEEFARAIDNYYGKSEYPGFLNTFFLTGLMMRGLFGNRVAVDINWKPGFVISTHKGVYAATADADSIVSIDKHTGVGPAFGVGLGVQVLIKKHLVIRTFAEFIGGSLTRRQVATRFNGNIVNRSNYDSNPDMFSIGVALGFGY